MTTAIPLGRRESVNLEFKAAEAVAKPFSISREVVAMLNKNGGEIWVGLNEDQGQAVQAVNIPNIDRVRDDLVNHFVEAIEPRLHIPEDIAISVVPFDQGSLLRIDVRATQRRGPFAQLKNSGRYFLTRVDQRIRSMTREELKESFGKDSNNGAVSSLPTRRDAFLVGQRTGFWIGIEPSPPLSLDVQDANAKRLLLEPERAGNRAHGWNYSNLANFGTEPRLLSDGIELGRDDYRKITVREDGTVEFSGSMSSLHHRTDAIQEIYPLALLEYCVSTARFAATLYDQNRTAGAPPQDVFIDVALRGIDGWHLPAFPPGTYGHSDHLHGAPEELEDNQFTLRSPLRFSWNEFRESPDHAGYMLVRSIYQAFHLGEDRIPSAYNRQAKKLVISN